MYNIFYNDMPTPYAMHFQDSSSLIANLIADFHDTVMFYLILILCAVSWILLICIRYFNSNNIAFPYKYLTHGKWVEIIWTTIPALILCLIALPSFELLYLSDLVENTTLTIKAIASQWFWSYEYSDFIDSNYETIGFDSYLKAEDSLEAGELRLLDVDNRLIIPTETNVNFIVTATDVIHNFFVPSLGIKIDATPGRLNQISTLCNRPGYFYGQCSEICGVNHAFMPISIQAIDYNKFLDVIKLLAEAEGEVSELDILNDL